MALSIMAISEAPNIEPAEEYPLYTMYRVKTSHHYIANKQLKYQCTLQKQWGI